jgi:poly(3-hydroxybutyrate) depolymerase
VPLPSLRSVPLLCVLLSASCSLAPEGPGAASAASGTGLVVATARPFEIDLSAVPLGPGQSELDIDVAPASSDAQGAAGVGPMRRHLVLVVPSDVESRGPRPLVVFLHGTDGARWTASLLRCLVAPGLERVAPIILGPTSEHGEWWSERDAGYILGLVAAAIRDWHVRPERVVIMGYSNGGIATWVFARLYPAAFSAAIPMASNPTVIGETPLPVYAIHGSKDEQFDIDAVREGVATLAKRGFNVQLVVRNRAGHMDACGYEPELEGAATWLERSVWTVARKH